jgi:hypothetical protein
MLIAVLQFNSLKREGSYGNHVIQEPLNMIGHKHIPGCSYQRWGSMLSDPVVNKGFFVLFSFFFWCLNSELHTW